MDAGIKDDLNLHVAFASHDKIDEEGEHFNFGVSIPIPKAMAPETLLAFAMNGEPLAADHGFPLRVVTPGYAGVRSPKWLATITVQERPSDNHIQQKEYKLFPSDVTKETADFSKGLTIGDMSLNSAICGLLRTRSFHLGTTPYAVTQLRRADRSFVWTCRLMAGRIGVRRTSNPMPIPPGAGRFGT